MWPINHIHQLGWRIAEVKKLFIVFPLSEVRHLVLLGFRS